MREKRGGGGQCVSVFQESSRHGGDFISLVDQTNVEGVTHDQPGGTTRHTDVPDFIIVLDTCLTTTPSLRTHIRCIPAS